MLAALGLDQQEDSLYRYLVGTLSASFEELSTALGFESGEVMAALTRLEAKGFVHRVAGDPVRFAAASPGSLTAVLAGKLAGLRQAQETLSQLSGRYYATRLDVRELGNFEVIHGAEALRERALDLVGSARSELLNMVKPPHVAIHPGDRVRPAAGVRQRLIYDNSTVDSRWTLDEIKDLNDPDEGRVHTKVPLKLIAIDGTMAIASIVKNDGRDAPVGALIGQSPLLEAILTLFDYVWDASVRLRLNETGLDREASSPLRAADRQLLSLLVAGLTDESVAAHLGVSVRTVERRTRALMDAARVRSRTQLAWKAATLGWL